MSEITILEGMVVFAGDSGAIDEAKLYIEWAGLTKETCKLQASTSDYILENGKNMGPQTITIVKTITEVKLKPQELCFIDWIKQRKATA